MTCRRATTYETATARSPPTATSSRAHQPAKMGTLDPIEGLTDKSAGKDYFEVMRSNLKALQSGQGCS